MHQPIMLTKLRKLLDPRSGYPERETGRMARASDIVLAMMIALLVAVAVFRILHG